MALEIYTVYVVALLVMEKGVYTQVEWQPSLITGSTNMQKAEWGKANLSIDD